MDQYTTFLINHWQLWAALFIIIVLILINEVLSQNKRPPELSPSGVVEKINHQLAVVIDLRSAADYRAGHIIDAYHIEADGLEKSKVMNHKNKPIILVCARGLQSGSVAAKMLKQGFSQVFVLAGGMTAWQNAGFPLSKDSSKSLK